MHMTLPELSGRIKGRAVLEEFILIKISLKIYRFTESLIFAASCVGIFFKIHPDLTTI